MHAIAGKIGLRYKTQRNADVFCAFPETLRRSKPDGDSVSNSQFRIFLARALCANPEFAASSDPEFRSRAFVNLTLETQFLHFVFFSFHRGNQATRSRWRLSRAWFHFFPALYHIGITNHLFAQVALRRSVAISERE